MVRRQGPVCPRKTEKAERQGRQQRRQRPDPVNANYGHPDDQGAQRRAGEEHGPYTRPRGDALTATEAEVHGEQMPEKRRKPCSNWQRIGTEGRSDAKLWPSRKPRGC